MMLEILENWTKFNSVVPQGTLTIAPKTGILIPGANFERLYEAKISKSGQMDAYAYVYACACAYVYAYAYAYAYVYAYA